MCQYIISVRRHHVDGRYQNFNTGLNARYFKLGQMLKSVLINLMHEAPLGRVCISPISFIFSSNIPCPCNYSVLYPYNDKICEYVGDGQNIALLTSF